MIQGIQGRDAKGKRGADDGFEAVVFLPRFPKKHDLLTPHVFHTLPRPMDGRAHASITAATVSTESWQSAASHALMMAMIPSM